MMTFLSILLKRASRPIRNLLASLKLMIYFLKLGYARTSEMRDWINQDFPLPTPQIIKWSVLRRWGGTGTWIETGTFYGETTKLLSTFANVVFSIEPAHFFAQKAINRFASFENVHILEGASQDEVPKLLEELSAHQKLDVSFWLDGHFSSGQTFRGSSGTPIREELATIALRLPEFERATILVDDIRCFSSSLIEFNDYPSISYLSSWAEQNGLTWTIEYDIFIATKR